VPVAVVVQRDGHEVGTACVEEFLAGAASGQAAEQTCSQQALRAQRQGCEWTGDSAGLTRATGERRVRLPRGANVYASRISTVMVVAPTSLPAWFASWEVSSKLTCPT
jgi:hypothetical protein